jgi:AhpD family alkylhydroperoxidase
VTVPSYPVHTIEAAPAASRPLLKQALATYGVVPNLLAVLSSAPPVLEAYLTLQKLFATSSLSAVEQQVVLLTVSTDNACTYCVAAHTLMAATQGVDPVVLEAIRSSTSLGDPRLEALRAFTQAVVSGRGWPPQDVLDGFLAAGYGEAQVLEVVLGIAFKTLSNYANHLTGTPLDAMFETTRWSAGDGVADD